MTVSVNWELTATEFANCNCSYGCPCQFAAPQLMAIAGISPDTRLNTAILAT